MSPGTVAGGFVLEGVEAGLVDEGRGPAELFEPEVAEPLGPGVEQLVEVLEGFGAGGAAGRELLRGFEAGGGAGLGELFEVGDLGGADADQLVLAERLFEPAEPAAREVGEFGLLFLVGRAVRPVGEPAADGVGFQRGELEGAAAGADGFGELAFAG